MNVPRLAKVSALLICAIAFFCVAAGASPAPVPSGMVAVHIVPVQALHSLIRPGVVLPLLALGSLFLMGMASSVPNQAPNIVSASGNLAAGSGVYHITKAGVAAIVLALPTVDGQRMLFIDDGGHAHTITCTSPPSGINAAVGTLTFGGTAGSSVELHSLNGRWYTGILNGVTAS